MEQTEPLDERLAARATQRAELESQADKLAAVVADAEVEVDAEIAAAERERAATAEPIPSDLLDRYDQLRKQFDGVAIARWWATAAAGAT